MNHFLSATTKAVSIIVEKFNGNEQNLFPRVLLLLQTCWLTKEQIQKMDDIPNACIDMLALWILHEQLDRYQWHAFGLVCLNEEQQNKNI